MGPGGEGGFSDASAPTIDIVSSDAPSGNAWANGPGKAAVEHSDNGKTWEPVEPSVGAAPVLAWAGKKEAPQANGSATVAESKSPQHIPLPTPIAPATATQVHGSSNP